jgi:hypothetical protein
MTTAEQIGKEYIVTERTIRNDAKYSNNHAITESILTFVHVKNSPYYPPLLYIIFITV